MIGKCVMCGRESHKNNCPVCGGGVFKEDDYEIGTLGKENKSVFTHGNRKNAKRYEK